MNTQQGRQAVTRKPLLVITSQVVRGGISGRGLVFALERLGHAVWFLPTILLPWHPGQGAGTRIIADPKAFESLASDLAASPKLSEIGGVLTGYLGHPEQAGPIRDLVKAVKEHNPDAPYICDPVMGDRLNGDEGRLYIPEETAKAIRDELVPLADIVTPNCFELGWLTGREVTSELQALSAARHLGAERVLVTSAPALRRNAIANLLAGPRGAVAAEHALVAGAPHGTGDLMAGLFLSRHLDGYADEEALVRATGSTFELLARSVKKGADELLFADEQQSLARPMALVSSRRVLETAGRV